ncbi:MAG: translation elongation factor Ts [Chloroflexi bacterium]|nr:MAG: translation elongation factor Ts [Chloroflexota bacterium]
MEQIKALREKTSAGVMECKNALQEAEADLERAFEILQERGLAKAEKKKDRLASEGRIEAYVHHGSRIGAMVELNCETDFVAKTDEFKALAHDLALQVVATNPRFLSAEDIPEGEDVVPEEACLLEQPFIKDESKRVRQLVAEVIAKTGEKVHVRRFVRFEVGEED